MRAQEDLLTPEEVAEYLKVPIPTIWRWCRKGTLPALKIGKYWRIPRTRLDEYLSASLRQSLLAGEGADE